MFGWVDSREDGKKGVESMWRKEVGGVFGWKRERKMVRPTVFSLTHQNSISSK